jgi:hypothetical protein
MEGEEAVDAGRRGKVAERSWKKEDGSPMTQADYFRQGRRAKAQPGAAMRPKERKQRLTPRYAKLYTPQAGYVDPLNRSNPLFFDNPFK